MPSSVPNTQLNSIADDEIVNNRELKQNYNAFTNPLGIRSISHVTGEVQNKLKYGTSSIVINLKNEISSWQMI